MQRFYLIKTALSRFSFDLRLGRRMMPMTALSFCLVLLLGALSPAIATSVQDVSNLRYETGSRVSDMADLLSDGDEYRLNQMIYDHEVKSGNEIAIVTVRRTEVSTTPKDFATELFNEWGIGKAEKNNGLLFFVSQGDRRVEIETGYGLEASLPDAEIGSILRRWVTPEFKQGNFNKGIEQGTKALIANLEGSPIPPWEYHRNSTQAQRKATESGELAGTVAPLILFILFALAIKMIEPEDARRRSNSHNNSYSNYDYGNSSSSSNYSDSYSSGSDFSGGSDFGGGSSGGGGAGDSW